MAARIVHFGADECARLTVLESVGYQVDACGTSIARLVAQLQACAADAVLVTESRTTKIKEAVTVSRANTPAPLVLFEDASCRHESLSFDVIIPPLTPPADWLREIHRVIEQSRKIVNESHELRASSAMLRHASAEAVRQSARERERSVRSRENSGKPPANSPFRRG